MRYKKNQSDVISDRQADNDCRYIEYRKKMTELGWTEKVIQVSEELFNNLDNKKQFDKINKKLEALKNIRQQIFFAIYAESNLEDYLERNK